MIGIDTTAKGFNFRIHELDSPSHNAVLFTRQNLLDNQKQQARENIGAADISKTISVLPQSLTEAEKQQARANIGEGAPASSAVSYNEIQSLSDTQKNRARTNIDAAGMAELAQKANVDGYYAQLGAGTADISRNLIDDTKSPVAYTVPDRAATGVADNSNEGFSITPEGSASLAEVRGNSIVWNQIQGKDNFTNYALRSLTHADGVWDMRFNNNEYYSRYSHRQIETRIKKNDIIIISFNVVDMKFTNNNDKFSFSLHSGSNQLVSGFTVTSTGRVVKRLKITRDIDTSQYIRGQIDIYPYNFTLDDYLKIGDDFAIYNLTQMFGAGNEPATVEEFEAMFPNAYYPYSAPTLISNKAGGIVSQSANAYNHGDTEDAPTVQGVTFTGSCEVIKGTDANNGYAIYRDGDTPFVIYNADGTLAFSSTGAQKTVLNGNEVYQWKPSQGGKYYVAGVDGMVIELAWTDLTTTGNKPFYNIKTNLLMKADGTPIRIREKGTTGDYVSADTIFPNGLRSAGSVYDSMGGVVNGRFTELTKRVGSYTFKDSDIWERKSGDYSNCFKFSSLPDYAYFNGTNSEGVRPQNNILISKMYTPVDGYYGFANVFSRVDNIMAVGLQSEQGGAYTSRNVFIKDTSAAGLSNAQFAQKVAGLTINYRCYKDASYTNFIYEIHPDDQPSVYLPQVADHGILMREPMGLTEGGVPQSAPMKFMGVFTDNFVRSLANTKNDVEVLYTDVQSLQAKTATIAGMAVVDGSLVITDTNGNTYTIAADEAVAAE